MSWSEVALI